MDVLLACFLLSFLSILCFSNSMLVCVCYPGWRVFRTSHTCIYPFPTFPTAFLYVYYFGSRVFRTNHTCIFPFPLQLFQPLFRLASCFQNGPYMRSSVPFPTFPTAILYTFIISASRVEQVVWTDWARNFFNEMQFHDLNESNELTWL